MATPNGTPSRENPRKRRKPRLLNMCQPPQETDLCKCTSETAAKPTIGKVTNQFPYTNIDGIRLFSRFRYEITDPNSGEGDKTFRYCEHYDRTSIMHVSLIYRADKILEFVANSTIRDTLYLVEGENDVEAAEKAGLVATTTHLGTKFTVEIAEHLKGFRGTILIVVDRDHMDPDHVAAFKHEDPAKRRDYPGSASAIRRVRAIKAVEASLKVFFREARKGKDLRDHLEAGRLAEDLVRIRLDKDIKPRAPREIAKGKRDTLQLSRADMPEGPAMGRFVAALEAAGYLLEKIGATRYKTNCPHPEHADNNPSFEFEQGDKGVVATCESAECTAGDGVKKICENIDIRVKDLFDETHGRSEKETPDSRENECCPGAGDPMEAARFIQDEWVCDGHIGLMYIDGDMLRYGGTHWERYSENDLRKDLYKRMDKEREWVKVDDIWKSGRWKPTPSKIGALMQAVQAVNAHKQMPAQNTWLGAETAPGPLIPMANGLFSLSTRTIHSGTPAYFNTWAAPFEYDEDAECPDWIAFLEQIFEHDSESIVALQLWFGYLISGQMGLEKGLMMIGPPRCGKGTILLIAELLIGVVAATNLSEISKDFGLQGLVNKPLTVIPDSKPGALRRDRLEAAVEKLLSLIANDMMTVNRKNRSPLDIRLNTKLMLATNDIHFFNDASGAINDRWIPIQFRKSFKDNPDPTLKGRLAAEIQGIFNWALLGLDMLTKRKMQLLVPASGQEVRDDMQESSPYEEFVERFMQIQGDGDEEFRTDPDKLRSALLDFFHEREMKPGNVDDMPLKRLKPIIERKGGQFKRKREGGGERKRYYGGARLVPNESRMNLINNNGQPVNSRMTKAKERI